jgi:hypothetical protein
MDMKNGMRHSLLILLAAVMALTSCNPTVQFSEPMPPGRMNLPNIPKAMRGVVVDDGDKTVIGKDTLWMGDDVLVNGEDFLLRRMAGHIMMNKRVPETGHWEVVPIRKTKDSMYLCQFDDDSEFVQRMSALLEVAPETLSTEDKPGYGYSLLSPSAQEFKQLLQERLYSDEEGACLLPKGGEVRP